MAARLTNNWLEKDWLGSFLDNAWTLNWTADEWVTGFLEKQPPGSWMKGHLGYKNIFRDAMLANGTALAFVYRDLRDVAVSSVHHIESDDTERLKHPDRQIYLNLPSHEERLIKVIEGLDGYPGLIERWEVYAPWLDVRWVFPLRFEHMRQRARWLAGLFVQWAIRLTANHKGMDFELPPDAIADTVDDMVRLMGTTEHSPTYRKGAVGGWRDEFTPRVKECFKAHAGDWLVRLGYEKDNDW